MLTAVELLRLKQLQFEVASRRVLQTWKPEDLSQPKCPQCQQPVLPTPYFKQEQPVYYCLRCNTYAGIRPSDRRCHCKIPGENKSCHGCPNFERFMHRVNAQLQNLD